MEKDPFQQFQSADAHHYVNLLPSSKELMKQISTLAQNIFSQNFRLYLQNSKGDEDAKQSTEQEYMRYKQEAQNFYSLMKNEREELKRDDEISQLYGKMTKEMSSWEKKYDRVVRESKRAFQDIKQILSALIPHTNYIQLAQKKEKINRRINQCHGMVNSISIKLFDQIKKCQKMRNQILPQYQAKKLQVSKEIMKNFNKCFQSQVAVSLDLNIAEQKKIVQIQDTESEIQQFLNSVLQIPDKDLQDNLIYNSIEKEVHLKIKMENLQSSLRKEKIVKHAFVFGEVNQVSLKKLISEMIERKKLDQSQISRFLIQPIADSNRYYLISLQNPLLDRTQYQGKTQFYYSMGYIHLSNSIVVAGGYLNTMGNQVHQIFQTREDKTLPSMKLQRRNFPMVQFNDGKTIISICGANKSGKQMNQSQRLNQFTKWSDLPRTNEKCSNLCACAVDPSLVYIFGGYPTNRKESVQSLDLNKLYRGWENIQVKNNPFVDRQLDIAIYMKERQKIVVFGSYNGAMTMELTIKDDKSLEIDEDIIVKMPFNHSQHLLIVSRKCKGVIYALNNEKNILWRFQDGQWK